MNRNPAFNIKTPKSFDREGLAPCLEEDIDKYYKKWALGTHERVWIDVLLYTGLRRGDAVRIGWKDLKDNIISTSKQKRTNFKQMFLLSFYRNERKHSKLLLLEINIHLRKNQKEAHQSKF